jgi:hypothetical protein
MTSLTRIYVEGTWLAGWLMLMAKVKFLYQGQVVLSSRAMSLALYVVPTDRVRTGIVNQ